MTINICLCGTEAGYPHDECCPFPYFGNDDGMMDRWDELRVAAIERKRWYEKVLEQEDKYYSC
jgi:hypothetical protein